MSEVFTCVLSNPNCHVTSCQHGTKYDSLVLFAEFRDHLLQDGMGVHKWKLALCDTF